MQALLIELLTEELPPKALERLGQSFASAIEKSLQQLQLIDANTVSTVFATPRRLAVHFSAVRQQAPEQPFLEKLMPVKVGLDADGQATPALVKKLAAKNLSHVPVDQLEVQSDGKQDYLFASGVSAGAVLAEQLQSIVEHAIGQLPIPKMMSYQLADGKTTVKFVRPVHGVIALWGDQVLPLEILGIHSGQKTKGHRFLSEGWHTVPHADQYEQILRDQTVIASFDQRRQEITNQLTAQAAKLHLSLGDDEAVQALLNEVTALVEYPAVYVGQFDPVFLEVPAECLILTMRLNQKYFPLFQQNGQLSHYFLIVSNMPIENPCNIIAGNEKVVRPRLADAQFFYNTDRKIPLADRSLLLDNIVYHNKLGSQAQRVARLRHIAQGVAQSIGADPQLADRAAMLSKNDLTSNMVGEFPELQGIIGAYYARHDGEPEAVIRALERQYQVRYTTDVDAVDLVAVSLYIAERLETLVGIWGIGLQPTGERDPYGLRRAALGLIGVIEKLHFVPQGIDLRAWLQLAYDSFNTTLDAQTVDQVYGFMMERYRQQLSQDYHRLVVDAVLAVDPPILQIEPRVKAVAHFNQLEQAASLAEANKRIHNLLRKVDTPLPAVQEALFQEQAEKDLYAVLETLYPQITQAMAQQQFVQVLDLVATTKDAVAQFFDDVMVMAEDEAIRQNRLALLQQLYQLMNLVADIARLAA